MPRSSGPRAPMPVLLAVAMSALLAACANNDPLSYIPAQDRALLQAQQRLGGDGGGTSPITVDALLNQARVNAPPGTAPATVAAATDGHVALRYDGDAIQPDAAQREAIHRFATVARDQGLRVTVLSRQDSFADPGVPLLGQRRATAVARELQAVLPDADVDLRFEPSAPAGVVLLSGRRPDRPS